MRVSSFAFCDQQATREISSAESKQQHLKILFFQVNFTATLWKNTFCRFSIPSDESGHFRFDWDPTVVYELVYRDESSNRSTSPSSSTSRIWNLLTIAGSVAIMWLGSIIASLWSNVYEDVFKILS
ncbi:unnamed protein product [Rotaria socialis]